MEGRRVSVDTEAQIRGLQAQDTSVGNNPQNPFKDPPAEQALIRRYVIEQDQLSYQENQGLVGRSRDNGLMVVVKRVSKVDSEKAAVAQREISALKDLSDASVPALIEWLEVDSAVWTVLEYRPGQSFRQIIESNGPLEHDVIKSVATQLFAGIAAIFNSGFVHLRICDETVFLDDNLQIIIKNFEYVHPYGVEKVDGVYAITEEKYGSDIYVAPEVFATRSYNARKACLWACGVLLYFVSTGQLEKLSNLGHPAFESVPDAEEEVKSHRRKLSVASQQAVRVVMYPNRLAVPTWTRDVVSKLLVHDPLRRRELIEVAAQVPKEFVLKDTRPLMELAWQDYKNHVGPLAGLNEPAFNFKDSASSFFSAASSLSNPFSSIRNMRRKSSLAGQSSQNPKNVYAPRRQTIAAPIDPKAFRYA